MRLQALDTLFTFSQLTVVVTLPPPRALARKKDGPLPFRNPCAREKSQTPARARGGRKCDHYGKSIYEHFSSICGPIKAILKISVFGVLFHKYKYFKTQQMLVKCS